MRDQEPVPMIPPQFQIMAPCQLSRHCLDFWVSHIKEPHIEQIRPRTTFSLKSGKVF